MMHDQYFTDLIKLDGPLNIPSTRMRRRPDGLSAGLSAGLSPRLSGSRTPGKTPNIVGKTPDSSRTPAGKTPNKVSKGLPQQRGPWKTPSKTPNKGTKLNQQDRFIPTRTCSDLDAATFAISKTGEENEERKPGDYETQLSEAMKVSMDSKILSYQATKPKPAEGYLNSLNVVYSQKAKKAGPQRTSRSIPNAPERILDAPELRDDYYLNLMDWSCNNQIAVGLGSSVYLWNATSGKIVRLMDTNDEEDYVCSVKWITEGNYLAVGTSAGAVELYDVEGEKLLRTMQGHAARVGALSWNSYICSSGSRSGAIHHHDVRIAAHQVASLVGHTQEVCGLSWSPDGRYLASGGNDNVLHVWNRELGTDVPAQQTYTYHQAAVKALAWCPWQHNILASGGGTADRTIRLWNVNTATMVGVKDTRSQVCSILFSKEYRELVSGHGYSKNQLSVWKYPDFQNIIDLLGHKERILSMTMSPDGSLVASAAADQTIRVWKCFECEKKKTTVTKATKESSILLKPSIR